MELKRIYDPAAIATFQAQKAALEAKQFKPAELEAALKKIRPEAVGIRILRAGQKQKFSPDLVSTGIRQGWLSMANGKITLRGSNEIVAYKIVRAPGYYCCHCKQPVHDSVEARQHIELEHPGKKSPDPENSSGYMKTNSYKGVKETSNG